MVSDSVVRSQSGRIIQNTLSDSWVADPRTETSTYMFDAAGRLTQAVIPRHVLSYGFGDTTCGVGASDLAGRNGNRTSFSDVKDAGTPITTDYCYEPLTVCCRRRWRVLRLGQTLCSPQIWVRQHSRMTHMATRPGWLISNCSMTARIGI